MKKKAIVDIDNTLWHFCDAFYEQLRKVNEKFPTPDRWTHWDLWVGYCSEDDFYRAVNAVHEQQDSENYLPYPEAKEFLAALKVRGYHITIASHRSPDYQKQTEKWLEQHGLVYDELHLSFNKTILIDKSTHIVVDDSPHVLEKAVENCVMATGLLFPWNEAYLNDKYRLFRNLNEILRHIDRETHSPSDRKMEREQ